MIDDDPDDSSPSQPPSATSRVGSWFGQHWIALAVFALALIFGVLVSLLWMRSHPAQPATATNSAAVTLDPMHPPLPAPMPGALSTLPAPAPTTPAPGTAHIVAPTPQPAENTSLVPPSETSMAASDQMEEPSDSTPSGDVSPQLVKRTRPDYPIDALRVGDEGEVQLQIAVDAQGNVSDVQVTDSSRSIALDRAASDAARSWQFHPAMRDGQAVPSTIRESVDFRLSDQH